MLKLLVKITTNHLVPLLDQKKHHDSTMTEVEVAKEIVYREIPPTLKVIEIPIGESYNHVLAEDIVSNEPIPNYRMSAKTGFAVNSNDGSHIRNLRKANEADGKPDTEALRSDESVRIRMGGVVPAGADAVVPVEDTQIIKTSDEGGESRVKIFKVPFEGQNIKQIGADIEANTNLFKRHERIKPAHIGVLASLGNTRVKVFKKPTIGLLSVGMEVRPLGTKIKPGQFLDSTKLMLFNLLKQHGFNSVNCGIVTDDPVEMKAKLTEAFAKHDIIISAGPLGELDLIKQVLREGFIANIHFSKLNIRPAEQTMFASLDYKDRTKYIFALSGDPTSASVALFLIIIPALKRLERAKKYEFPEVTALYNEGVTKNILKNTDPTPECVLLIADSYQKQIYVTTTQIQISSKLNSMVNANALFTLTNKMGSIENDKFIKCLIVDDLITCL